MYSCLKQSRKSIAESYFRNMKKWKRHASVSERIEEIACMLFVYLALVYCV